MKVRADRRSSALRGQAAVLGLLLLPFVPCVVIAQQAPLPVQPAPAAAPADQPPPLPPPGEKLTPNQLDGLVAPIALYPDPLVSQVLVASTYPKEVTMAIQWLNQHRDLTGKALAEAAQEESWDPSIKALIPFASVLRRLNQDKVWTTNLGNAFLAQQADVMQAVQRMRRAAKAAGKLSNTRQMKVIETSDSGETVIEIEPARPDVLFVPAYNPAWIWGPAVWYPYPRWIWGPPPPAGVWFGFGPAIAVGAYFGPAWGGWGAWGWRPGWVNNTVVVNNVFVNNATSVNTAGVSSTTAGAGAAPRVASTAPAASAAPTPGASPSGNAPAPATPASAGPTPAGPNSRGVSAPRANPSAAAAPAGASTPAGNQTSVWTHDPSHRQGVPYPNAQVAQRFHAPSPAAQARQVRPQGGNRGGGRGNAPAGRVRNAPRAGARR